MSEVSLVTIISLPLEEEHTPTKYHQASSEISHRLYLDKMRSEDIFMSRFILEKCYEEIKYTAHIGAVHAQRRKNMEASRSDEKLEGYLTSQMNENIFTLRCLRD
jgi:hypothetical protein